MFMWWRGWESKRTEVPSSTVESQQIVPKVKKKQQQKFILSSALFSFWPQKKSPSYKHIDGEQTLGFIFIGVSKFRFLSMVRSPQVITLEWLLCCTMEQEVKTWQEDIPNSQICVPYQPPLPRLIYRRVFNQHELRQKKLLSPIHLCLSMYDKIHYNIKN